MEENSISEFKWYELDAASVLYRAPRTSNMRWKVGGVGRVRVREAGSERAIHS